jgi:hypothetical protein
MRSRRNQLPATEVISVSSIVDIGASSICCGDDRYKSDAYRQESAESSSAAISHPYPAMSLSRLRSCVSQRLARPRQGRP